MNTQEHISPSQARFLKVKTIRIPISEPLTPTLTGGLCEDHSRKIDFYRNKAKLDIEKFELHSNKAKPKIFNVWFCWGCLLGLTGR